MNFVRMTKEDLVQVADIENGSFRDPWTIDFFEKELDNELAKYILLKENDRVLGYAGIWEVFENVDLNKIAIRKEERGRGFGEALLKRIIIEAIKDQCEFIHLEVRPSNQRAIKLYEKMGFEAVRTRHHYYEDGEDCIDMMKGIVGLSEEDFSDRVEL